MKQATKDAIQAFLMAEQLRHQEEQVSAELAKAIHAVPAGDMTEYLEATRHIEAMFIVTCPVCTPVDVPASERSLPPMRPGR